MVAITIAISTKNRRAELDRCLESLRPYFNECEVIVADDGSGDDTQCLVKSKYPEVGFIRHEQSVGYIVRRNQLVMRAKGRFVMFIDDDACVQDGSFIHEITEAFRDENVQAVALPYIDVNLGPEVRQFSKTKSRCIITQFRGTACAVRRAYFLDSGGFPETFVHLNEESAFCAKIYRSGGYVLVVNSSPILHYESPVRSPQKKHYFNARNALLYAALFVPFPFILHYFAVSALKGPFRGGASWVWPSLCGTISGCVCSIQHFRARCPIPRRVFTQYWVLRKTSSNMCDLEKWLKIVGKTPDVPWKNAKA